MYRLKEILKALADKLNLATTDIVDIDRRCNELEKPGAILTHGGIKATNGANHFSDNETLSFALEAGVYLYVNSHIYINHIYLLAVTNSSSLAPRLQLIGGSTSGSLSIASSTFSNNKWTVSLKATGQARGYLYKLGDQLTV